MFYFKYTTSPSKVQYTPFQLKGLKHYLHMQCTTMQNSPYHQHVDIKATLQKVIKMVARVFKFNTKAFYIENFTQPDGKTYIMVNNHRANFTSHQPNNPWLCNKVNFIPIIKTIFNDAETVHALPDVALQKRPYYPHVQILPETDIKHLLNQENKQKDLSKLQSIKLAYQINHSNDTPYPYSSNYRRALKPLWSPYQDKHYYFTAYYAEFQPNSTHHHQPAVLLQNVQYHHHLITNHCLLFDDNLSQVINSRAREHTTIGFFATVDRYMKHTSLGRQPYLDFSLHNIANVQANPKQIYNLPTNKDKLIKLISKYFDTSQLRYLLINKITHKQQMNTSIYKEIDSVKQRLAQLRNLAQPKSVSQPVSKSKHQLNMSHLYSAIADLWSGKDTSKIMNKYYIDTDIINSVSNQLHHFIHTQHAVKVQSMNGHTQYSAKTIKRIYKQMINYKRHSVSHNI